MHPAALACDHAFGGEVVRSAIDAGGANAAIFVADKDAAFFVDSGVEEVEEVAAGASIANAAALDGIAWCYILRRPSLSAVKSSSDIEKPHTWKRWRRTTIFAVSAMKVGSACFAAKEGKGRAPGITSHDCGKYSVEHRSAINNRSTYICILAPSHALVG